MWFWNKKKDKKKKDVVISQSCYSKLPVGSRQYFSPALHTHTVTHEVIHHDDSGDNFGLSALVAMETDNTALGYLAGGSLSGAMVGEMMAEHHHAEFGGGSTDGGGAGGSWDTPTQDYSSPSPSVDSTSYDSGSSSSYDSGSSSYDSGSSFDSGSSSFDSGSSF